MSEKKRMARVEEPVRGDRENIAALRRASFGIVKKDVEGCSSPYGPEVAGMPMEHGEDSIKFQLQSKLLW